MKKRVLIGLVVVLALGATTAVVWASVGDGLVSYWPFEEEDGNQAYDAANGNEGTILGPTHHTPGAFGKALDFDGVDDIVTVSHSASLNIDTAITVQAWVYADTVLGQRAIIRKGLFLPTVTKSWGLDLQGGKARFFIYDGGWYYIAYSAAVSHGTWHHLVGTYDGETVDIYLDGDNALSTKETHSGDIDTNTEAITIGKHDSGYFFDGRIDEVGIWNRALSAAEIHFLAEPEVAIDIKPGSFPNCFNVNGHGVIPVAILSSAEFDATSVDPGTVTLGSMAVRFRGKGYLAHAEDVDGDGVPDLVMQIEDNDNFVTVGETMAELNGRTYSGLPFFGSDSICMVP